MCGGGKSPQMPQPQAPPAPVPARDTNMDAQETARNRQLRAASGSTGETTTLAGNSPQGAAPTASPILGG